jgi:AmmeMemoRadiSam system protein A
MSLSNKNRQTLVRVAKQAIELGLQTDGRRRLSVDPNDFDETLQQHRATFVTLEIDGELRGCIGTLEAHQPLVCDVAFNAHAAAFSDPRFLPLTEKEYPRLDIHISILSPAQPMKFHSEDNLITQLQPGIDGLILQDGINKGTFLPSVWESLPDARQFFAHLKRKAGLPMDYWSDSLQVYRYTTESFGVQDVA